MQCSDSEVSRLRVMNCMKQAEVLFFGDTYFASWKRILEQPCKALQPVETKKNTEHKKKCAKRETYDVSRDYGADIFIVARKKYEAGCALSSFA